MSVLRPPKSLAEKFSPEWLARRGHYHPHDRERWIRLGYLKADGTPTLTWNGDPA